MLIGASAEEEDAQEVIEVNAPELRLRPRGIAVYDPASGVYVRSVVLDEPAGVTMPLGEDRAVCFFKHPRIISLDSGKTIVQCDDLDTGNQSSSIIWNANLPAMAIDSESHRFAVASANEITVIQVEL